MQELLASLPSWRLVRLSRRIFLQRRLRSCGSDLDVSQGVIFEFPERIDLGDRVFVNRGTVITARTDIQIGDDVLIGPYVVINSGDHNYFDPTQPIGGQGHAADPITIGNDVWLGRTVRYFAASKSETVPWWPRAQSLSMMSRRARLSRAYRRYRRSCGGLNDMTTAFLEAVGGPARG